MKPCCPTCGRTLPLPTPVKASLTPDLSTLSEAELYAHYKKTAARADLLLLVYSRVNPLSDALMERIERLLTQPKIKREDVERCFDAWRLETEDWSPWTFEAEPQPIEAITETVEEQEAVA